MRDRKIVLEDVIKLRGDLEELGKELSNFSWDSEISIAKVFKGDVLSVFDRYLNDMISAKDIEVWADIIECRDDVSFEDDDLQELIFELANPEINGYLTKVIARDITETLMK